MTAGIALLVAAGGCAVWASVVESDGPGWRNALAMGLAMLGVFVTVVELGQWIRGV